jgi:hypothetical protein
VTSLLPRICAREYDPTGDDEGGGGCGGDGGYGGGDGGDGDGGGFGDDGGDDDNTPTPTDDAPMPVVTITGTRPDPPAQGWYETTYDPARDPLPIGATARPASPTANPCPLQQHVQCWT